MSRKAWLVVGLALLLLVIPGSAAFAQDGEGGNGDKFVFGEDYVLRADEVLNGNLAVLGGNVTLERGSTLNGDLAVAGGKLAVAGTVRGSVVAFGGATTLESSAVIEGDLAAFGGAVERAPGSVIQGEVIGGPRSWGPIVEVPPLPIPVRPVLPLGSRMSGGLNDIVSWELGTVGAGLLMVLLSVLAVLVAPRAMGRIASTASGQPVLSFGVGLLTFVVAALAGTLLLIACCTGLLVWLALAAGLVVGWIAVGLWFGQRLLAALKVRTPSTLVEVGVGVFLITFASRLPLCIGFLISVVVGSIGLGAVVLTRFGTQPAGGRTAPPDVLGDDFELAGLLPVAPAAVPSAQVTPEGAVGPAVVEPTVPPADEAPAPSPEAGSGEPEHLLSPVALWPESGPAVDLPESPVPGSPESPDESEAPQRLAPE